jgi:hypothetical protein
VVVVACGRFIVRTVSCLLSMAAKCLQCSLLGYTHSYLAQSSVLFLQASLVPPITAKV